MVAVSGHEPSSSMRSALILMASTVCVSAVGRVLSVNVTRPPLMLMPAMLIFAGALFALPFAIGAATGALAVAAEAGASFRETSTPSLPSAIVISGDTMSIFGNSIFAPVTSISNGAARTSFTASHTSFAASSRSAISLSKARVPEACTLSFSPITTAAPSFKSSLADTAWGVLND